VPRKLYWADRLGVLVMADVPNSWGEPGAAMREDWETALRGMVRRGLQPPLGLLVGALQRAVGPAVEGPGRARRRTVLPETLDWVESRYALAKQLDPTRLVEDNSPCCGGGHVKTDLDSWHMYLPGWRWKETLDEAEAKTFPGPRGTTSGTEAGERADAQQRVRQRVGLRGLDRGRGLELRLPRDDGRVPAPPEGGGLALHRAPRRGERVERLRARRPLGEGDGPLRARAGDEPPRLARALLRRRRRLPTNAAKPGETVSVPLWASFLADASSSPELVLKLDLVGHDDLGRFREWWTGERRVPFVP